MKEVMLHRRAGLWALGSCLELGHDTLPPFLSFTSLEPPSCSVRCVDLGKCAPFLLVEGITNWG